MLAHQERALADRTDTNDGGLGDAHRPITIARSSTVFHILGRSGMRTLRGPGVPYGPAMDAQSALELLTAADRLLVQQVFKPIGNEYRISVPAAGSTEEGAADPLRQAEEAEDQGGHPLPAVAGRGRRTSSDQVEDGVRVRRQARRARRSRRQQIGLLGKNFGKSLLRSHWHVSTPPGTELFEAHESSWPIALIRRFIGFVPVVGGYLDVLSWLPFNFVLRRGDTAVGTYKRVLGKLRDRYVLELAPDAGDDRPAARRRVRDRARRAAGPLSREPTRRQACAASRTFRVSSITFCATWAGTSS